MSPSDRIVVGIVVAGGTGERLGRAGGKQMLDLAGRPVVARSVEAVANAVSVCAVVVVCHEDRVDEYRQAVERAHAEKPIVCVAGGATRQGSVTAGMAEAARMGAHIVVIHDGARPLLPSAVVDDACAALCEDADLHGVVAGYPVTDTLKVAHGAIIESTPDRSRFWAVQTPQVFHADILLAAISHAERTGFEGTDDASVVEHAGGLVGLVVGPRDNLKITLAEDVAIAEAILAWNSKEAR